MGAFSELETERKRFLMIPGLKESADGVLRRCDSEIEEYLVLGFYNDSGSTYVVHACSRNMEHYMSFDIDIDSKGCDANTIDIVIDPMRNKSLGKLVKRNLEGLHIHMGDLNDLWLNVN